jgi:light-regulated signal transduction histidine kinase (bacteriophytochrome)
MTSPPKDGATEPSVASTRLLASSTSMRARALRKPRRDALTRVRHDLRSLVHSVVGYSDLLASPSYGPLSTEQLRFVNHVRTAAEQLQELVDTCIELSRPAGESTELEPTKLPLGAALRHVQAGLAHEALRCGLTLTDDASRHECAFELPVFLRALRGLAQVVSRDGSLPCTLHGASASPRVTVALQVAEGACSSGPLCQLDTLEDDVGNRDFVRLKLSEVLLSRLGIDLQLSRELDRCELTLR